MIDRDRLHEHVSRAIKQLREKHPHTEGSTTQKQLADAIGIDRSTLANIETGQQRPPLHVVYGVCDFFGVSLDAVLPKISSVAERKPEDISVSVGDDDHPLPEKTASVLNKIRTER